MKKFICGLLTGILLMMSIPVFGAVGEQISVAVNSIKVMINGEELAADNFVYNGRTYVQLKALTDFLDGKLQWDEDNNTAIAVIDTAEPAEPTEVNPLPTKDIEESKPVTEATEKKDTTQTKTRPQTSIEPEPTEEPQTEPISEPEPIEEPTEEPAKEAGPPLEEPDNSEAIAALKEDYEADIDAIEAWGSNMIKNLNDQYGQWISAAGTEQMKGKARAKLDSEVNGVYEVMRSRKAELKAQYEADLAKLQ